MTPSPPIFNESYAMKTLLIGVILLGAAAFSTGCATPAYSAGLPTIQFPEEKATGENANNIVRNAAYEFRQMTDDFNMVMLMDTPSRLTRWNLR
jgi:hypothetical protein